jgi:transposase
MVSVDVPRTPDGEAMLPPDVWAATPAAAQALMVALVAGVAAVAGQVAGLRREVGELRAQLGRHSGNSSRPPSSDPPWRPRRLPAPPSGRRPGGQPGHAAHQRAVAPPERVDRIVDHRPVVCARCAAPLPADGASTGFAAHQVTDLPVARAVVTEHRLHRVVCPACGALARAVLPTTVPSGAFGPGLQATVAVLRGQYHLSQRAVADLCGTVLDAPLAASSVAALCQETAAALAAPVAAAQATLPDAPVANADETRWPRPQAGQTRWLWVVVTGLVTVFVVAASRGNAVIKGLLGEDYQGVLGSDRYSAYAWLNDAYRQVCWAHLIRDFAGLVDRGGGAARVGRAALRLSAQVFALWHQYRDGTLDRAGLQAAMRPVQDAFATLLTRGSRGDDPRAATLCTSLDRLWPALWTFVDEPGVDPTNNAAERALRPAVLWRKGSYGTQSDAGDRVVERLLTVTATCRQHGRSALAYLTAACAAAQRGLPAPSLLPTPTAA